MTYAVPLVSDNNLVGQPLANGNAGVKSREVYQAPNALPPLEEGELDQLITEEKSISQQPSARLYFPNAKGSASPSLPLYGSNSDTPLAGAVQTSWFSFDKISDHYMDKYLKLIRSLRD